MEQIKDFDIRTIRPLRLRGDGQPDFGGIPANWANSFEYVSATMFEKNIKLFLLQKTRIDLAFSETLSPDDNWDLLHNVYVDYVFFIYQQKWIEEERMDDLIQNAINVLNTSPLFPHSDLTHKG